MMKREIQNDLPPKYYLDNFTSMLSFVEGMYGVLLKPEEQDFIERFRELSEDAQCLFVRFANRRGLFFRTEKLEYPEIAHISSSLDELLFQQFCEIPSTTHQTVADSFLNVYSRQELSVLCKSLMPDAKGLGKLKKGELIGIISEQASFAAVLEESAAFGKVVKHNFEQELEMLKFLFFGHLGGDMSEFVIRDLGMVRFEAPEEEKLVARFHNRREVDDKFLVSVAYNHFRNLREQNCPLSLYNWYTTWCREHPNLCEVAQALFSRLTIKTGRILERHKHYSQALEVYEKTEQSPSRERRVRLLQKTGAVQEGLELCYRMERNPQNAEEQFFAREFISRLQKKKVIKSTTLHLKDAETIRISGEYRHNVEKGVIRYFTEQGQEALYSENYLWRSCFGLVFWDIIFDHEAPVYHSPLQRSPSDLYLPDFLENRKERMQERMQALSTKKKLLNHIEKVYEEKRGLGNPLVGWHENSLPLLRGACRHLKPKQLEKVFMEMAGKLKENGRGFPDLFTCTKADYTFIEVKSPNDTLSGQQLFWLRFFQEAGIKAKVLKVEWEDD